MIRKFLLTCAAGGLLATSLAHAQSSISASDRRQGAEAHPQLLQEFGGAYRGPQADYVRRVGQRIAVQSGLSNAQSDFTVTLLNSNANNAFAIPGGYVYVTRQLMALMNDEAELASVMGHEVGHVAAQHARSRNRASTGSGLLAAILGAVTGSSQIAQLAGQAAQLVTLRFSRQQEYEADDLGVQYLTKAGYDPYASATLLASLAAQSALDARLANQTGRNIPTWASTHPDPAARVQRAAQRAGATGVRNGVRNRDAFLQAVDGVRYDDDPEQGVVEGRTFRHPTLRLAFTAPDGFAIANGAAAVTITGNSGQAQFTGGRFDGNLLNYIATVFRGLAGNGQLPQGEVRRTRINGLDAAYSTVRANTQSGAVDATVFAYAFDRDTAYHFVLLTPAGRGVGPFASLVESVRRLTPQEAAQIRGRRVDVVTVGPRDTIASLSARMAYAANREERFRVLNAFKANSTLRPGQKVKLIVYG